ncbi:MAG: hypothetical protein Q9167_004807 [Letrouitia subvulpina]
MTSQAVTLLLPQGSSDHGDPRLLCLETRWYNVATFMLGNYVTHAATVKSRPGDTGGTSFKALLFALCFPTSAIVRGVRAILQCVLRRKTSLGLATRAGAMCMVVRSEEWLPRHGDHINFAKIETVKTKAPFGSQPLAIFNRAFGPASFSMRTERIEMDDLSHDDSPPTLNVRIDTTVEDGLEPMFLPSLRASELGRRRVHGLCELPPGYALQCIAPNSDITLSREHNHFELWTAETTEVFSRRRLLSTTESTHQPLRPNKAKEPVLISSHYSFAKALIALFQVSYSVLTVYRAQGDQLATYGYAAFGLTVTPYSVMSFINLCASLLTPDYATMYLVDSDIMVEARKRGGRFEGVVGLAVTDKSRAAANGRGKITARFRFRDRSASRSKRPKASSTTPSGPPTANEVELSSAGKKRTFKIHKSSVAVHDTQLTIPAHHPMMLMKKSGKHILLFRWGLPIIALLISGLSVFAWASVYYLRLLGVAVIG